MKWSPQVNMQVTTIYHLEVLEVRPHMLNLAHDHPWSEHLGVNKTYSRIRKRFFWPALSTNVVNHGQSCHAFQRAGKLNQVILFVNVM